MTKKPVLAILFMLLLPMIFSLKSIATSELKVIPQGATPGETELFNNLKARYNNNKDKADPKVDDIIQSFDAEQSSPCPNGHPNGATVKFQTELATWKPPQGREDYYGYCEVGVPTRTQRNPVIVKLSIQVMFNLAKIKPGEDSGDAFNLTNNDMVFYHEMLHAWLDVHSKRSDKNWCKEFCEGKRGFEGGGTELDQHREIGRLEGMYGLKLAQARGFTVLPLKEVKEKADLEGNFGPIVTGLKKPEKREDVVWEAFIADNIAAYDLDWNLEGLLVLSGTLKDKTKSGYIGIKIDPSNIFMILLAEIYPQIRISLNPVYAEWIADLYPTYQATYSALESHRIDMADCPLTLYYKKKWSSPPYSDYIKMVDYGGEAGYFILELNNNNNPTLPDGSPNPAYPNVLSVVSVRQGISYLVNRTYFTQVIAEGLGLPMYTPVPNYMTAYINPAVLKYEPYSRASAEALFEAGGLKLAGSPDGQRYWDRNANGAKDTGEDVNLAIYGRSDHTWTNAIAMNIAAELTAVKVRNTLNLQPEWVCSNQVSGTKAYHIYTGYQFPVGPDPDYLYNLYHGDMYWHPGKPPNYNCINDPNLNTLLDALRFADTVEESKQAAMDAQLRFADIAASIPLFSTLGSKAYRKTYLGTPGVPDGEDAYEGQRWEGIINQMGSGVDNWWSFVSAHPNNTEKGGEATTLRYGFSTPYIKSFNPIYASSPQDQKVLNLIYDSLLKRNPYSLDEFMPWLAEAYEVGTYAHPIYGTCSKIKFTLRPDATWADGTPITTADVYFTFVKLDDILAARGLPPPWWMSSVMDILDFRITDPYNFEVLFNVKSVFALSWLAEQIILPKHVWKPLAESSNIEDTTPDPNMISSGAWRFKEYVENSHVLLVANRPGSMVQTSHVGSVPVTSPKGYWRWTPMITGERAEGDTLARISYGTNQTRWVMGTNHYLGGNVTIDSEYKLIYPNGTTVQVTGTDIVLLTGSSWNWIYTTWQDSDVLKGKITIDVRIHVKAPTELAGWLNSTKCLWATIKEDICGRTFYDDIGLGTYRYKSELPSPDIKVNIRDISRAARAFGSYPGHARWDTAADINVDYKINIRDISLIAKKFGWVG